MFFSDTETRLLVTAALWGSWCTVHSLVTEDRVINTHPLDDTLSARYYRFLYVCFAAVSFSAVLPIIPRAGEIVLWSWEGPWKALQLALWGVAIAMGYLSLRFQDVWAFLGLRPLAARCSREKREDKLITYGTYGVIRNPQFAAGLLFLWTRDISDTALITNLVLTAYLILGAKLEERKLVVKFGDQYLRYKSAVPAFIPKKLPRMRDLLYPADQ
jgi:protein-S-isoprenylcysteine O-methyltransferase Ste14